MGMSSFGVAELSCDDHEYESWMGTLTQASARLDVLETAVAELCQLCRSEDVHSKQVLEVLARHGAISQKTARAVLRRIA